MKLLITLFFITTFVTNTSAQNFELVDSRVILYPKRYASAEQLASQIEKDFTADIDKVRAIYKWLTLNVAYDLETYYNGKTKINFSYSNQEDLNRKLSAINTHTVNQTLSTNKAVCEGYAQTFKKVSELLNVPCLFIGGFSKTSTSDISNIPLEENHA